MKPQNLLVAIVAAAMSVMSIHGVAAARTNVAVTACGQRVLGDGYLVGNLDCTTGEESWYPAVTMAGNGSLHLSGFSIVGGDNAVRCEKRCRVFGGHIGYGYGAGVTSLGSATVSDISIVGRSPAVSAVTKIIAERSTFSSNWSALWAGRSVVMIDSMISGSLEYGVMVDRRATLRNSSITGSALSGVHTNKSVLVDSSVTGNGTDPECGVTQRCADLRTFNKPLMRRSTCETSSVAYGAVIPPYTDWDVCALD